MNIKNIKNPYYPLYQKVVNLFNLKEKKNKLTIPTLKQDIANYLQHYIDTSDLFVPRKKEFIDLFLTEFDNLQKNLPEPPKNILEDENEDEDEDDLYSIHDLEKDNGYDDNGYDDNGYDDGEYYENHNEIASGEIISVKDGIAFVSGLTSAKAGELVKFVGTNLKGMIFNLETDKVGCVIFGDDTCIQQGNIVQSLNTLVQVNVGPSFLGHVVDGLGNPIDGWLNEETTDILNVERKAPGVITRESVTEPMLTGYKVVDSMLPIGRGQRELIIGDRQTGKTTIAIDAILNQRYTNQDDIDIYCIYVGIGQKKSSILNIQTILKQNNADHYTTIVAATASQSASLQYIAPYTGCAFAEYYRDQGEHALIIYDDLSKHAAAYRQLSLLLRRPPGREAFPGDVFYAHSRLLERACKLNPDFGGGSLTALPIVETQAGDLSGYIPTNVISITDGQIFLEKDLFFRGIRPAVNVGSSVSRVGSKAQPYALRLVTGSLRYQLAQYREYLVFAQFDNDIDDVTRGILNKGALLTEILKQGPNKPLQLFKQALIILAGAYNYISPFIKDYKKDLTKICSLYEEQLFKFIFEREERKDFFYPFFDLLIYAEKGDFEFNDNPLLFILNSFTPSFYKLLNKNIATTI